MNRSIYVHNVGVFVFSVLLGFFLLGLANSFIGHMTPDISICLLYTQTFLESWNRFRYSYDSKGIVVIWMLLPFVRLFGPNMIAAAMAQMVAYGIGLLLVHRILRGFLGRLDSLIVVLAGGCLLFSHFIWGGNVRADDFGFAFAAITVYGMWRGTHAWRFMAGFAAGLACFTKFTLVVTPLAILCVAVLQVLESVRISANGALWSRYLRETARCAFPYAIGFLAVAIVVIGWVAAYDDIWNMYAQTVVWPAQHRFSGLEVGRAFLLLIRTRLIFLYIAAIAGFVVGWKKGFRRVVGFCATVLFVEFLRVSAENATFPYLLTISLVPLLVGASLLGGVSRNRISRGIGWIVPVVCLMPILPGTLLAELRAFEIRTVLAIPSPYEYLAEIMRPVYGQGETVFVDSNEFELVLLLKAPRGAIVLPHDFGRVSDSVQSVTKTYYASHPPDWIILRGTSEFGGYRILGDVDFAFHGFVAVSPALALWRGSLPYVTQVGRALSPQVDTPRVYKKEFDTGYAQAWHLID